MDSTRDPLMSPLLSEFGQVHVSPNRHNSYSLFVAWKLGRSHLNGWQCSLPLHKIGLWELVPFIWDIRNSSWPMCIALGSTSRVMGMFLKVNVRGWCRDLNTKFGNRKRILAFTASSGLGKKVSSFFYFFYFIFCIKKGEDQITILDNQVKSEIVSLYGSLIQNRLHFFRCNVSVIIMTF